MNRRVKKPSRFPRLSSNSNAVSHFREELRLLSGDNKLDHANSLRRNAAARIGLPMRSEREKSSGARARWIAATPMISPGLHVAGELTLIELTPHHVAAGGVDVADRGPHGFFKRRRLPVKCCIWLAAVFTWRAIIRARLIQRIGTAQQITIISGEPERKFKHARRYGRSTSSREVS